MSNDRIDGCCDRCHTECLVSAVIWYSQLRAHHSLLCESCIDYMKEHGHLDIS